MIATIAITAAVFLFFAVALGISSLAGRKPIAGSCGGLGAELCVACSPEEKARCRRMPPRAER